MSDVKKVLTLVACGCICLMVATSASADFVGVKTVNKDDADTNALCTQAGGNSVPNPLTVCNVFVTFDNPTDRLLSVGDCNLQVFNGANDGFFFHHPVGADTPYTCSLLGFGFPDLICDTYVTIGNKCNGPDEPAGPDTTAFDGAWDVLPPNGFNGSGHISGGWFASPANDQGLAGTWPDNQVLIIQSSVLQGRSMSGIASFFWQPDGEPTIAEVGVPLECLAKCEPGPCNDGDPCTGDPNAPDPNNADTCTNGVCSGPPIVCPSDGNDCTDDFCDSDAGGCVNVNVPNGTGCDDGNPCTSPDSCTDGQCGGVGCVVDSDCNDGDDCTSDVCDAGTGCCTNTPLCTSDIDCDDGLTCTDDACGADGCCVNVDVVCPEDNDPCTNAACEEPGGCTQVPGNEGGGCDDGVNCTGPDTCSGGSCSGPDTECPIPGQSCNENNGECEFCQTDDQCDDGQACNGSETCNPAEGCQPGTDVDCSGAGDQCNDGVCTEPDGDCGQEPANEGGTCTDDNLCTNDDACSDGDCVGVPKECDDGFVCDPSTGDCVEVSDFLDIIPGKCPNQLRRNGLGFVKISLLGTDDLDANDVDISTLLLRNVTLFVEVPGEDPVLCQGAVAPRSNPRPHVRDRGTPFEGELCGCHSSRKDGVADLDMKFKLAEIVNELCLANQPAGTEVRLELTGSTLNDQPIRAADCVILGRDLGPNP